MAMPKDSGIKKWTTLATWSDAAVYAYFTETRGQGADHALASLTLLRSKFDRAGNRVTIDKRQARAALDPEVIARARGQAPSTPSAMPASEPEGDAGEGETSTQDDNASDAREPEAAPQFEYKAQAGERDAVGEALAKLVAPWMLETLEPALRAALKDMHAHLAANQKERVVIVDKGKRRTLPDDAHALCPKVLALTAAGANVMLVGPAGCGKTYLAGSVAKALERPLTVVSCSAGMSEAQLLGRLLPLKDNGAFCYVESPFMKAYREGGVILLDEMDAADANLLLVINAALANGMLEIEARAASHAETRVERHPDTVILSATNTWGAGADTQYIGRGALDVSTLDRFYRLAMDYDHALERKLGSERVVTFVHNLRRRVREFKLRRVVSTRMIQRLEAALAAGVAFDEATRDELASWTADERAKVGA